LELGAVKKQNQRNLVTQSQGSKIISKNDNQDCQATENSKTGEIRRHKVRGSKAPEVVPRSPGCRKAKPAKAGDAKSWV
jgi:hypothetical protein